MRKLFSFIFIAYSIYCSAQNLSVSGVSLMDSYNEVEKTLESRFGVSYSKEYNEIKYYEVTIGGIYYDSASFEFVYRPTTADRRLNYVSLSSHFKLSELSSAKAFRDRIAEVYSRKYTDMDTFIKDDGFKIYRCALNRYREVFMIIINLEKEKSKGGDTYYYVTVSYGPAYTESTDDI